jgi:uncharacterized protein DUF2628
MPIYTVHEPPPKRSESAPDPERFAFVRDGFSFWAFLFGPLWMLRHRMWLVFAGYVLVVAALEGAFRLAGSSFGQRLLAGFLIAVLVGLEAPTLRRFTLARRKWKNLGITVGDDVEAAESRFFAAWADEGHGGSLVEKSAIAPWPQPSGSEVIGLFPEAGVNR